jgi:ketosteroid isomerase-like protein
MASVVERLHEAVNQHDIEALLECFDAGYRSEQPAHPNRGFGGKEQVRKNWSGHFESFPDFKAELLRYTAEGDAVWSEWHWSATGLNISRGDTLRGAGGAHSVGTAVHGAGRRGRGGYRRSHAHYDRDRAGKSSTLRGSQSYVVHPNFGNPLFHEVG